MSDKTNSHASVEASNLAAYINEFPPTSHLDLIPLIRHLERQLSAILCQPRADKFRIMPRADTFYVLMSFAQIRNQLQFIASSPGLENISQALPVAHMLGQVALQVIANTHAPATAQRFGGEIVKTALEIIMQSSKVVNQPMSSFINYVQAIQSPCYMLQQVTEIMASSPSSTLNLHQASQLLPLALQIFAALKLGPFQFQAQHLGPPRPPVHHQSGPENSLSSTSFFPTPQSIIGGYSQGIPIGTSAATLSFQDTSSPGTSQAMAQASINRGTFAQSMSMNESSGATSVTSGSSSRSKKKKPAVEINCKRKWTYLRSVTDKGQAMKGLQFMVMSYNVLSQKLLTNHPYLYSNCRESDLDWGPRSTAILLHIKSLQPDIVCLQEMEEDFWNTDVCPYFTAKGYRGLYKKRTGDKTDGCGILFIQSKFSLIDFVPVEFCKGGVMDRDNVGIIAVLKPNGPEYTGDAEKICIATTHLLFNPKRGDIKLGQLMILLAELDKHASLEPLSRKHTGSTRGISGAMKDSRRYCPTILCGDFNMEPFSQLYKFMREGHIHYADCAPRFIAGQREGHHSSSFDNSRIPYSLLPQELNISEKCHYFDRRQQPQEMRQVFMPESNPQIVSPMVNPCAPGIAQYVHTSSMQGCSTPVYYMPASLTPYNAAVFSMPQGQERQSSNHDEASSSFSFRDQSFGAGGKTVGPFPSGLGNKLQEEVTWEPTYSMNTGHAYHSFNFKSVYPHQMRTGRKGKLQDEVSSYHARACCTVDYIFYSCDEWVPVEPKIVKGFKHKSGFGKKRDRHHHDSDSPRKRVKGQSHSLEDATQCVMGQEEDKDQSKMSKMGYDDSRQADKSSNSEAEWVIDLDHNSSGDICAPSASRCEKVEDSGNGSVANTQETSSSSSSEPEVIQQRLELVSRYNLLTQSQVQQFGSMPNVEHPSDHLCLLSTFVLH